jgi:hypothetical protein
MDIGLQLGYNWDNAQEYHLWILHPLRLARISEIAGIRSLSVEQIQAGQTKGWFHGFKWHIGKLCSFYTSLSRLYAI